MSKKIASKQETFGWLDRNKGRLKGLSNFGIQQAASKGLGKTSTIYHVRLWVIENDLGAIKSYPNTGRH